MFLTYKKGLRRDGKNPVLLTGYGGFGISASPFFDLFQFVEKGGVLASANIRGGGEFGEKWHEAGMKLNKQNVFDDFIASAEYLIREKYTSPEKLAIKGGSNGGLLVSACLVQRPELFKVVIAKNSVTDMLKSQKWEYEYGSVKNNEEYRYLRQYSPLLSAKTNVHYPATMITTGMKDDNVPPWHSFKFAATLQNAQIGENPVLLRTDSIAGHSPGIDATVDCLSFLFEHLKMKY
jgi:prolyl oligopeptidase